MISALFVSLVDLHLEAGKLCQTGIGKLNVGWHRGFLLFENCDYAAVGGGRRSTSYPGDQQSAQQLSNRGFRDRIDEDESSRALEVRDPESGRMLRDRLSLTYALRLTNAATIFPHLSSARQRPATSEHRRCSDRAAFDLTGDYVLAAGDDHVVGAAGDEQIAVLSRSPCHR